MVQELLPERVRVELVQLSAAPLALPELEVPLVVPPEPAGSSELQAELEPEPERQLQPQIQVKWIQLSNA